MSVYRVEKKSDRCYLVYKDDYLLAKEFKAYREATHWIYGQGACPACGVTIVNTRCECERKGDETYSPTERAAEKVAAREVDEGKSPEELAGNSFFNEIKVSVDLESAEEPKPYYTSATRPAQHRGPEPEEDPVD